MKPRPPGLNCNRPCRTRRWPASIGTCWPAVTVVHCGGRDGEAPRMIRRGIVDDVQLETARCGPFQFGQLTSWPSGIGVASIRRSISKPSRFSVRSASPRKPLEGLGEDCKPGAPDIGVRQRRARKLADPQMVVMMRIGVPDRLEGPASYRRPPSWANTSATR